MTHQLIRSMSKSTKSPQSSKVVVFSDPTARQRSSSFATSTSTSPAAAAFKQDKKAFLSPNVSKVIASSVASSSFNGARVPVIGAETARVNKQKNIITGKTTAPATTGKSLSDQLLKKEIEFEKKQFDLARKEVQELGMKGQMKNKKIRQKLRVDKHGRPLPKLKAPYKVLQGMKKKQKETSVKERENVSVG